MDTVADYVKNVINTQEVIRINISTPIYKSNEFFKIVINQLKNEDNDSTFFQIASYYDTKVKHENINTKTELIERVSDLLALKYKNIVIITDTNEHQILCNKKNYKVVTKKNMQEIAIEGHNKKKNYILQDGTPIQWLIDLGVMNKDGKVLANKQKKFKQINKFLEYLKDIEQYIQDGSQIVDVGCGKSYLTFAIYYYFNVYKNKNVKIVGLDIKKDVIEKCNQLKDKVQYKDLEFINIDIKDYNTDKDISLVVSLHACDTATDYTLYNAIRWNAKVILSVPCCQHELFNQIQNDVMNPMLKHGILREKFASLLTDTVRATLLEASGYSTTVMEFIDTEHTPKNIMIKGIKNNKHTKKDEDKYVGQYKELADMYGVDQKLYELLYVK